MIKVILELSKIWYETFSNKLSWNISVKWVQTKTWKSKLIVISMQLKLQSNLQPYILTFQKAAFSSWEKRAKYRNLGLICIDYININLIDATKYCQMKIAQLLTKKAGLQE